MGGVLDSTSGFLGLSDGPRGPAPKTGNRPLYDLQDQSGVLSNAGLTGNLRNYANGGISLQDALNYDSKDLSGSQQTGMGNALATGATTGSRFASDQVASNPILGGLYGQGGQLSQAEGKLSDLQNQGFELKPEDQTLYGQESGNIARQFGQQGNQTANSLASRGLSSSGAAGAQFSGLEGNKNEMLAQAQQQIAQQRFQNTMGQIGQYQNFVNSMGANAGNAVNQQYGRQLAGATGETQNLQSQAGITQQGNASENSANIAQANFQAANKPKNFMDFATAGTGQGLQALSGGAIAGMTGGGGSSSPAPAGGPSLGNFGQGSPASPQSFFGLAGL